MSKSSHKLTASEEFKAKLRALSPEDRRAVANKFAYRLDHHGGKVEYALTLQQAIDMRQRKPGEAQAQVTALPWKRSP